jgi:hypothetical protein
MERWTRNEFNAVIARTVGDRLPGRPEQDPYIQSLTQNYKIGARKQTEDGLVWHYGRAHATYGVTATYRRRGVASVVHAINYLTVGTQVIGSKTIVIDDAVHGLNYWENGEASIQGATASHNPRMIKSSTATNGTSVTLTLYYPIDVNVAAGVGVYCCPSMYAEICEAVNSALPGLGTGEHSIAGFTWIPVTAAYYVWVQTWGLAQSVECYSAQGIVAGDREIYFNWADGTTMSGKETLFAATQRAGFLVPGTILAPGGDEAYLMLQLDP